MNCNVRHSIILVGMLGTLTTSGCEIPQADVGQPLPPALAGHIAQKRQGLTTPVRGKVASFTYGHTLSIGSGSGCTFLLEAYPTRLFSVLVDSTDFQGAAAEGMCRMALDSLKEGSEVTVAAWGDDGATRDEVAIVTMTR